MTRRGKNNGDSESEFRLSPTLGNPHTTRVPTFPQRRPRLGSNRRCTRNSLESRPSSDSCTEPDCLAVADGKIIERANNKKHAFDQRPNDRSPLSGLKRSSGLSALRAIVTWEGPSCVVQGLEMLELLRDHGKEMAMP